MALPNIVTVFRKNRRAVDYYDLKQLEFKLSGIIETNALHRKSDGICWALYYLERLTSLPSEKSISAIIDSKDCVALAMLCNFENSIDIVSEYAKTIIDAHIYLRDQNWVLLYQLFIKEKIPNPYPNEGTLALLKKYDVDFFCKPGEDSRAKDYCIAAHNPFVKDDERPNFDQWMSNV